MEEDAAGDDVPMETMDGEPVALEGRPAGGAKAKAARKAQPGAVSGEPVKDAPYLFLPEGSPVFDMLKYGDRTGAGGGGLGLRAGWALSVRAIF